ETISQPRLTSAASLHHNILNDAWDVGMKRRTNACAGPSPTATLSRGGPRSTGPQSRAYLGPARPWQERGSGDAAGVPGPANVRWPAHPARHSGRSDDAGGRPTHSPGVVHTAHRAYGRGAALGWAALSAVAPGSQPGTGLHRLL